MMKVSILSRIPVETKREMVGVLLIAFSFLTFISLVTYNATDLTRLAELQTWGGFWEGLTLAVHNQGGLLGALLSSALYYLLGYCVLLLPMLGMMFGIRQIFNVNFQPIQKKMLYAFWGLFVFGSILAISSIHQDEGYYLYNPTLSGYFGYLLAEILYKLTGLTGAYVLTITLLLMFILAVTPLRLASLKRLKNLTAFASLYQRIGEWPLIRKLFEKDKEVLIHPRTLKPERLPEKLKRVEKEPRPELESENQEENVSIATSESFPKISNKATLQFVKGEEDGFEYPALSLLDDPPETKVKVSTEELNQTSRALKETLATFGI